MRLVDPREGKSNKRYQSRQEMTSEVAKSGDLPVGLGWGLPNFPQALEQVKDRFPTAKLHLELARARCAIGLAAFVAIGVHKGRKLVKVFHLPCKWRGCKPCSVARRNRIYGRVKSMVEKSNGRTLFLTLTLLQPQGADVLQAWLAFADMWDLWWKRMLRAFPYKLQGVKYAWVLEPHQSGWPHLHVVLTGCSFLWVGTMQKHWSAVGGGNLDVRGHGEGAAHYVCKYIAKQRGVGTRFANWLTANGVRWYNSSHRAPVEKTKCSDTWRWWIMNPEKAALELDLWERRLNYAVDYHGIEPPPQLATG